MDVMCCLAVRLTVHAGELASLEIWYRWSQQQWKAVRLLGRVVAGREPGRSDDKQIIAFMNQGEGMQFAAVGRKLYDLARERGLGVSAPLEWFHQDKKYIP